MTDTVLRGAGYEPRTTSLDTLMAAPLGTHLCAAEALTDDNDYADEDGGTAFIDGYQIIDQDGNPA